MKTDKYVCTLSPELVELAKRELNEVPERRDQDIDAIRSWLKKCPHITADTSAKRIISFLRVSKFSIERTKEKIELHYKLKEAIPELYTDTDPRKPVRQEILKAGVVIPLEGTDRLGRRVFISRPGAIKYEKWELMDIFKANTATFLVAMEEQEECAVTGVVIIQDNANYSSGLASMINLTLMKKFARMYDCMPFRMKGSHNVNNNKIVEGLMNLIKPLFNEKIRNRFYFHSNFDSLFEHVPKEILPEEYGGNGESIQVITDRWYKKVQDNAAFLIKQEKYKSDQSKKPGPRIDLNAELFGIEGSFRKLEID